MHNLQAKSLHLLPKISDVFGSSQQYLGHSLSDKIAEEPVDEKHVSDVPRGHMDQRVVNTWLNAFLQGHLIKSRDLGSVSYNLGLSCLGTALFSEEQRQKNLCRKTIGGTSSSVDQRELLALALLEQLEPVILVDLLNVRHMAAHPPHYLPLHF
jgi:hypothetical protein